jgi:hypothetical protein
VQERKKKP